MRAFLTGGMLATSLIQLSGCDDTSTPRGSAPDARPAAEQVQAAAAVVSHVDSELRGQRELRVGETVVVRRVLLADDSGGDGPGREDVSPPSGDRWEEWPETVGSRRTRAGEIPRLGLGDDSSETTRNTPRVVWIQLARPRIDPDGESASVEAEVWMNSVFGQRSGFQLRRVNGRWDVVSEEISEFW